MSTEQLAEFFGLQGKVAVVTGGGGVLCGTLSRGLARMGVAVAVLDISARAAQAVAHDITEAGGTALALTCDVLNRASIEAAATQVGSALGRADILVNGAGGNDPRATTTAERPFFDLEPEAVSRVFSLNFTGTFLASQVFAHAMARQGEGVILNVSSMNALRPLTRIPAYSAAKAAVSNFTQWLAVHMAQEYSPRIRVNAIAPGFFLTDQNRYLLTHEDTGQLTPRGQTILEHTPMRRFGDPEDLVGTLLWLVSGATSFVTGVVVPVDGGFSAYAGV